MEVVNTSCSPDVGRTVPCTTPHNHPIALKAKVPTSHPHNDASNPSHTYMPDITHDVLQPAPDLPQLDDSCMPDILGSTSTQQPNSGDTSDPGMITSAPDFNAMTAIDSYITDLSPMNLNMLDNLTSFEAADQQQVDLPPYSDLMGSV